MLSFNLSTDANHFFSKNENLVKQLNKYIKKEIAVY